MDDQVPSAQEDPKIAALAKLKRSKSLDGPIHSVFCPDMERVKFSLVGAFSPSFVQGEINLANKNAGTQGVRSSRGRIPLELSPEVQ